MKANELRIGNYFLDRGGNILQLHFWEGPDKLAMNNIHGGITFHPLTEYIGEAKPIHITEEWLLRFGFEKIKNESYINGYEFRLMHDESIRFDGIGTLGWLSGKNKYLVVNTLCRGNYVCNAVRHVHELQNLYFVITGEEITSPPPEPKE